MKDLHSEISKIVNHAVYESGAGNDVLISNDVDDILTLIKKHEREVIREAETLLDHYSCGQHKKLKRLLIKLKEVEK